MCIGIGIVVVVPVDGPMKFFGKTGNRSHNTILHEMVPVELHNRVVKIEYTYPHTLRLDAPDEVCRQMALDLGVAEAGPFGHHLKPGVINAIQTWIGTEGITFTTQTLQMADLAGAYLWGADLEDADLEDANLRGANLEDANLWAANLRGANLEDANLWGANLRGADLEDADLRGAHLAGANLWGANLRGADLEDANLEDASLAGADLWGANLRGANLTRANLEDANLEDANLWAANLEGANLWGANLEDANLTGDAARTTTGKRSTTPP